MQRMSVSRRDFIKAGSYGLATAALSSASTLSAWAYDSEPVEAIVIGSGFGGAIAAFRLAQEGVQTLLLERGRRWPVTASQDTFATLRHPDGRSSWLSPFASVGGEPIDVYTGVLELSVENGVAIFAGSGYGGGSLNYNGATYQPSRRNFNRVWQGLLDYDEMDSVYYRRVKRRLEPSQIPDDILATEYYRLHQVCLQEAARAGLVGRKLDMNIDWNIIRKEINGQRVPSAIIGEFWYGNNSGCKDRLRNKVIWLA